MANRTKEEINASVKAYLYMLGMQREGKKFVKAKINRQVLDLELKNRSKGYLEFRHRNISYVLSILGETYVKGYLPAQKPGTNVIKEIIESLQSFNFFDDQLPYPDSSFKGNINYDTESPSQNISVQESYQDGSLPRGQISPRRKPSIVTQTQRDPHVKAWILNQAKGTCEGCNQQGPFLNNGGMPHLEVHHVIFLSEGGPDTIQNTVALCPNCHAKCHYAKDRQSFAEELTVRVLSQRPQ